MSNNSDNKNNINDNSLHNSINNSNKSNINIKQKGSIPEHLIFFKEDVLKDIKQLESKIFLKYDIQHNINTNKINKIESKIEQINQRIEYLTTSITTENSLKERVEKISILNTKLDENLILQDVRLKNINTKLTETIDKYDNIFAETVIYPGVIGPKAKYKTFHELIDFVLFSLNQLLMFKEKISIDLKEYKYKTDSLLNNFQIRLEYLTKNANAFTTSSIRLSENKIEQLIRCNYDEIRDEIDQFKETFNSFTHIQEDNIIKIIQNSKKFENFAHFSNFANYSNIVKAEEFPKKIENINVEKLQNFEKLIQNLEKENKKMKKEIALIKENIYINNSIKNNNNTNNFINNNNNINNNITNTINNNNNINNVNNIYEKRNIKKLNRGDFIINYYNDFNIKNATSIVKEYIKGKITENEVYKKRRSVITSPIYPNLASIKENDNITYLNQNINPLKKKEQQILNKTETIEDVNESSSKSEEEFEADDEKENENSILKNSENKNNEKNYEFQKHLYRISGKENDLIIERSKNLKTKKNITEKKSIDGNNSALNYIQLSKQLYQNRKNSMNTISSNSQIADNQDKKSNNSKIYKNNNINESNNSNNNFYITNNDITNNNSKKISKSFEPNHSKEKDNSVLEKSKKYEKLKDVKTIITVIKKENKEKLMPVLPVNKITERLNDNINNNNNDENKNTKSVDNKNNNRKKIININSRNKDIQLESTTKNYSNTKGDSTKIKLANTPSKILNLKNTISGTYIKLPFYEPKKLNKAVSAGRLTTKNKWNNAKKIDINFKPYEENTKEKDEIKMKKYYNQMKDFLSSDEKALLKDRFTKIGYDKEKIFINQHIKKKSIVEENTNININGIFNKNKNNNIILPKSINFEKNKNK